MKPIDGITVIFAAFVNDTNQTLGFGILIKYNLVDLSEFQRRLVTLIIDANYKAILFHG